MEEGSEERTFGDGLVASRAEEPTTEVSTAFQQISAPCITAGKEEGEHAQWWAKIMDKVEQLLKQRRPCSTIRRAPKKQRSE